MTKSRNEIKKEIAELFRTKSSLEHEIIIINSRLEELKILLEKKGSINLEIENIDYQIQLKKNELFRATMNEINEKERGKSK